MDLSELMLQQFMLQLIIVNKTWPIKTAEGITEQPIKNVAVAAPAVIGCACNKHNQSVMLLQWLELWLVELNTTEQIGGNRTEVRLPGGEVVILHVPNVLWHKRLFI